MARRIKLRQSSLMVTDEKHTHTVRTQDPAPARSQFRADLKGLRDPFVHRVSPFVTNRLVVRSYIFVRTLL